MESEEFYDSLESSEYDSLENSFQEVYYENNNNIDDETDTTLDDDIIPFYDKKLTKSQVELCKKSSKASTVVNKGSSRRKPRQRKKTTISVTTNKQKLNSKSYLDIFYAKIGHESAESVSSRATCVNLTSRTYETCGSGDDAGSLYFKTDNQSESSYASTNQDLALSLTTLMSNLRSVSEQNMDKKKSHRKHKAVSKIPVRKMTELGRLGPEISLDKVSQFSKIQRKIFY